MKIVGTTQRFNTGRHYTSEGQRIVWAVVETERFPGKKFVAFRDIDRCIDGLIEIQHGNLDLITNNWVLRAYDDHHYRGCFEVWQLLKWDE